MYYVGGTIYTDERVNQHNNFNQESQLTYCKSSNSWNGYNLLHCEGCSIDAISTNLGEHERPDKGNILSIFSALLIQSLKQPFKQ